MTKNKNRVYIYDTTLRDGAQTSGVSFGVSEKVSFINSLYNFGVDYIEAGWPGANDVDTKVFETCYNGKDKFKNTKITAFGMTKKHGNSSHNDPSLSGLVNSGAGFFCIVGKTWDFHVKEALNISLEENLSAIEESVSYLKTKASEVLFDAEHFFDGYIKNPDYAIKCLKSALQGGADWLVLCDTNGGMMPDDVFAITKAVVEALPEAKIGIHTHNDTECAVANTLASVKAGARLVQGTINGLGERCGNANLCSVIPNLILKMGLDCGVLSDKLKELPSLSKKLDDLLNREPQINLPYVGASAFVHKGGLHASAVLKNPATYEHIDPEIVGNTRKIPSSNQAGTASTIAMLKKVGLNDEKYISKAKEITLLVKEKESQGYSFENAETSFYMFVKRFIDGKVDSLILQDFTNTISYTDCTKDIISNSDICIELVNQNLQRRYKASSNHGIVDASFLAIKQAVAQVRHNLIGILDIEIADYKVKVIASDAQDSLGRSSRSKVRVDIKIIQQNTNSQDQLILHTTGVEFDPVTASIYALLDAYNYIFLYS
jgi:2-isopropylmalate synthase